MTNKTLVRIRVLVRAWIKIYMRTRNKCVYDQQKRSAVHHHSGQKTRETVCASFRCDPSGVVIREVNIDQIMIFSNFIKILSNR